MEVRYCKNHQEDGERSVPGCCCEDGVRCDSCGMHEGEPRQIDFAAAARAAIRSHQSTLRGDRVARECRIAVEDVLREVERQWRGELGLRGKFVLEDCGGSRPPSMVAWFHINYKRWWFWPGTYLGIILFWPACPPRIMGRVGGHEFKSTGELPGAFCAFLSSPGVGEKLAALFGGSESRSRP